VNKQDGLTITVIRCIYRGSFNVLERHVFSKAALAKAGVGLSLRLLFHAGQAFTPDKFSGMHALTSCIPDFSAKRHALSVIESMHDLMRCIRHILLFVRSRRDFYPPSAKPECPCVRVALIRRPVI
jgi:hypothetical protein